MPPISDLLKSFSETPDQLDKLPEIIAEAQKLEQQLTAAADRITGLTESNAKLLRLIPVDPVKSTNEPAAKLTIADAVKNIFEKIEKKEV